MSSRSSNDAGLVRRRPSAEDGRVVFGELTPKGRALMDDVFPGHVDRLYQVMAVLSVSEKRRVSELLRRLSRYARRRIGDRATEDD